MTENDYPLSPIKAKQMDQNSQSKDLRESVNIDAVEEELNLYEKARNDYKKAIVSKMNTNKAHSKDKQQNSIQIDDTKVVARNLTQKNKTPISNMIRTTEEDTYSEEVFPSIKGKNEAISSRESVEKEVLDKMLTDVQNHVNELAKKQQ